MANRNPHQAGTKLNRKMAQVEMGKSLWVSGGRHTRTRITQPAVPAKAGRQRLGALKGVYTRAEEFEAIDRELDREIERLVEPGAVA